MLFFSIHAEGVSKQLLANMFSMSIWQMLCFQLVPQKSNECVGSRSIFWQKWKIEFTIMFLINVQSLETTNHFITLK